MWQGSDEACVSPPHGTALRRGRCPRDGPCFSTPTPSRAAFVHGCVQSGIPAWVVGCVLAPRVRVHRKCALFASHIAAVLPSLRSCCACVCGVRSCTLPSSALMRSPQLSVPLAFRAAGATRPNHAWRFIRCAVCLRPLTAMCASHGDIRPLELGSHACQAATRRHALLATLRSCAGRLPCPPPDV